VFNFFTLLFQIAKFSTNSICLGDTASQEISKKILCEEANEGLFITEVEYKNDHLGICSSSSENLINGHAENTSNGSIIRYQSNKNVGLNRPIGEKCTAYPTQLLADKCNGKNECEINLKAPSFNYSFLGSNCYFKAEILRITYECIPSNVFILNNQQMG
jgi:hypothetical protein